MHGQRGTPKRKNGSGDQKVDIQHCGEVGGTPERCIPNEVQISPQEPQNQQPQTSREKGVLGVRKDLTYPEQTVGEESETHWEDQSDPMEESPIPSVLG